MCFIPCGISTKHTVCVGWGSGVLYHDGTSTFRSYPNDFNTSPLFPHPGQSASLDTSHAMIGFCPPTHKTLVSRSLSFGINAKSGLQLTYLVNRTEP